ncbi:MAG TPA: zinc ribbon domain-containing protein [Solirubrobacterales bacterium]|nr:zinc ribbon domain-containing protein [Solirubrobacterales bacterium]
MTCPSCGAALADDQRYCLNCGRRQGEPRVDFRRHLETEDAATKGPTPVAGAAGAPAEAPEPAPQKPQRDYAPLAAAGGIAVLGIMLLIGVLIGRGTGNSNDSAAAPQVVTVGAAPADGGAKEAESSAGGQSKKKTAGGRSAKKKNAATDKTDTGNAPVASEQQLEALQGKTGQEYAEESAKLPDEIATPGKAPPTDNKAPGGGTGGGVTLE